MFMKESSNTCVMSIKGLLSKIYALQMMYKAHRRSMETEAKANCRHFILGGKIECRTGNFWLECVALCT